MRMGMVEGDITKLCVDAIVNAANGEMRVISCVFGKETAVLYRAALDGIK
jgi:O-acetyl-ADP-ribose deacetylase (regulator of RNase III)